jgi:GNAT superfamily N-acetyltransferase
MDAATLRQMQGLAQEVWRRDPALVNVDGTVGEIAWALGALQGASEAVRMHRLWHSGNAAIGWGVIFPPAMFRVTADRMEMSKPFLVWQVHPDHPDLFDDILEWFATQVPEGQRETSTRSANTDAISRLLQLGYSHVADAPWDLMNIRDVRDIEEPSVPAGYHLKTMREVGDMAKRVAVHRAAWEPSTLTQERYAAVMSTWSYREDLDFVVEGPDGSLVASALGWYDEENRVGEFEPVGTRPDHRRKGLARAVMLFGMQRFREIGATRAIVGCRGDDDYPVPKLVYESIGFRELSRTMPFVQA